MKYVCPCGYVYDPAVGDPDNGVAPGTPWEDVPESWECPVCGNRDQRKMNVVRRTCGYLGENYWNVGKTKEIRSRVMHL